MGVESLGKGEFVSLTIARSGFAVAVWRTEGGKRSDEVVVWKVEEDGVTWNTNGTVDTGSCWG